MNHIERRAKVLEIIKSDKVVSTFEMAKMFDASVDTIRADLRKLGFNTKSAGADVLEPARRKAIEILNANEDIGNKELSDLSGLSLTAIYNLRKKLGKFAPTYEEVYKRRMPEVKKLLEDGLSGVKICKKLHISTSTLTRYRKDLGLITSKPDKPKPKKTDTSDLWNQAFFGKRK